jgi:hypothetical protein
MMQSEVFAAAQNLFNLLSITADLRRYGGA